MFNPSPWTPTPFYGGWIPQNNVLDHTIRSIAVAEQLLRDALLPFQPLADRRITSREEFGRHLDHLKALLVRRRVHVVKSADGSLQPGLLSPWWETEQALGVSESSRKAKVGILRLDPDVQEQVRALPAEHAIQISRLSDRRRQRTRYPCRRAYPRPSARSGRAPSPGSRPGGGGCARASAASAR